MANLIVDEALDHILLVSAHDDAADHRVVGLRPKVPWVGGVPAVFQGNQVVFLIAGHVVGMHCAPGGISRTDGETSRTASCSPCSEGEGLGAKQVPNAQPNHASGT